jgi:TPR repeat protein
MNGLAHMYDKGHGVAKSFEKTAELYALAANQGHATAQYNLGFTYKHGQGVAQSYEKAFELYALAANQGHALAQGSLGILYYNGEGTAQSNAMARKWFLKAALQEDELAIKYCKHLDEMEGKTTPTLPCCAACGTHETTRRPLKNCQQCHTTHYCNRDCQMKHWKEGHKRQCKRLQKEHEKKQVAAGGEK